MRTTRLTKITEAGASWYVKGGDITQKIFLRTWGNGQKVDLLIVLTTMAHILQRIVIGLRGNNKIETHAEMHFLRFVEGLNVFLNGQRFIVLNRLLFIIDYVVAFLLNASLRSQFLAEDSVVYVFVEEMKEAA